MILGNTALYRRDKAISKIRNEGIPEPPNKPPLDLEKFWAELDELTGCDFLSDGIPDDPPAEPDPRIFFDE